MPTDYQRFSIGSLTELARSAMLTVGASPEHADTFAQGCVVADVRGIESHGVARLDGYIASIERGSVQPNATPTVVSDAPSVALVDANSGIGHVASKFAMELAIDKAKQTGIGWVNVRGSNHYGIAGYYAGMALAHGMIGLCCTNAGPSVAPMGGKKGMLGTNPIAIAAPAGEEEAFLLDMATSVVAAGKFQIARWEGKPVPKGWGLDAEGNDTTEPGAVLPGGVMLPLGSFLELAGYKGYGLALAVEILTAILGGGAFGAEVGSLTLNNRNRGGTTSHFFAALDVARFIPLDQFRKRMDDIIRAMKATPLAPGHDRVYIAGEKEVLKQREHEAHGIPLHPSVVERLQAMAQRLEIPFPAPVV